MDEYRHARTLSNTDHASVRPLYVNNCGFYRNLERDRHTTRVHGRRDYLLVFILRGKVCCPERNESYGPGSILLYRPGELQDYIYCAVPDDSFYFFVHFSGRAVEYYTDHMPFAHTNVEIDVLLPTLNALFGELQNHDAEFETRCAGLLLCLLSEIPRRIRRADHTMAETAALLRQHYAEPLGSGALSAFSGSSGRTLARRFKQYAGVSPLQYQQNIRMEEGARLLRDTASPIHWIAGQIGYSDPLYFSRLFHRHFGKSPSDYRHGN